MTHPFGLLSSDEITHDDLIALLQQAGATLTPEQGNEGYLSYENNYVWIYTGDASDYTKEQLELAEKQLDAPPRSFFVLDASLNNASISYQLVYDFTYLCMQKYHCVLDNSMGELITAEEVKGAYDQRLFDHRVPPLPLSH